MRLAWLGEDDGARGDEVLLAAVRKIPGTCWLEGYLKLFVEVAGADVGNWWSSDDFEIIVLWQTLNLHLRW